MKKHFSLSLLPPPFWISPPPVNDGEDGGTPPLLPRFCCLYSASWFRTVGFVSPVGVPFPSSCSFPLPLPLFPKRKTKHCPCPWVRDSGHLSFLAGLFPSFSLFLKEWERPFPFFPSLAGTNSLKQGFSFTERDRIRSFSRPQACETVYFSLCAPPFPPLSHLLSEACCIAVAPPLFVFEGRIAPLLMPRIACPFIPP